MRKVYLLMRSEVNSYDEGWGFPVASGSDRAALERKGKELVEKNRQERVREALDETGDPEDADSLGLPVYRYRVLDVEWLG